MKAHYATTQLSGVVLRLQGHVSVSAREYGDEIIYILEDELKCRFYRVGEVEYTFISLINGQRTFADVFGASCSLLKSDALTEFEAASLCRWLVETGIAVTPQASQVVRLWEATQQVQQAKWLSKLNPLFVKTPLGSPDSVVNVVTACIGWFFSWWFALIWMAVVATGCFCAMLQWDRIWESGRNVISNYNWLFLLAAWLLMKILHETAHAVASKRYGVVVREFGVLWILCVPLPYVDVTAAWRLHSRSKRMVISAAGMYVELFLAAIAAIVWSSSDSPLIQQHAFNVMLTGSLVTLLFNANPLMRFDGYYALTDLLEMPNLATHGQQFLANIGRRLFWGLEQGMPTRPEGRMWLVALYGAASFFWRIVIYISLLIAACTLFHGAGIVLGAVAIGLWIVSPLVKAVVFTFRGSETESPNRFQFSVVVATIVAISIGILSLPYGRIAYAPLVVDYYPIDEQRTSVAGFVVSIHVKPGQTVEEGDTLIQLSNPELEIEHRRLLNELEQCRQRKRHFFSEQEIAVWQAERANELVLLKQIAQSQCDLNDLRVIAPQGGVVLNKKIDHLHGRYLRRGEHIVALGRPRDHKLVSLVSERDVSLFRDRLGQPIDVHIDGTDGHFQPAILSDLQPRATKQLPHDAFSASSGGELSVELPNVTGGEEVNQPDMGRADTPQQSLELTSPRFIATLELPSSRQVFQAGQVGCAMLRQQDGTIGSFLRERLARWYQSRSLQIDRDTRS